MRYRRNQRKPRIIMTMSHFSDLMACKWWCSQIWHVLSNHGSDKEKKIDGIVAKNIECCTFQNGHYCTGRSLIVRCWTWSAWREESGEPCFIFLDRSVQRSTGGGAIELVQEAPKLGQISSHSHHYKRANVHYFPIFRS